MDFICLALGSPIPQGALVPFTMKYYLKTKIWRLDVLISTMVVGKLSLYSYLQFESNTIRYFLTFSYSIFLSSNSCDPVSKNVNVFIHLAVSCNMERNCFRVTITIPIAIPTTNLPSKFKISLQFALSLEYIPIKVHKVPYRCLIQFSI